AIAVRGLNICGEGEYSEGFDVTVDNTVGIAEIPNDLSISIFPNPNNGQFILNIFSKESHTIDLKIFNPVGMLVFERSGITVNNKFTESIDLKNLSDSIYFLFFNGEGIYMSNKIIIRK
ncbi:MAG: T9SS type A sorting domain-containing protein, partial [Bacteroidetes bacterium]|nr:T9SS type A sorting domain-containing protein [Bacteroidota bacterium]